MPRGPREVRTSSAIAFALAIFARRMSVARELMFLESCVSFFPALAAAPPKAAGAEADDIGFKHFTEFIRRPARHLSPPPPPQQRGRVAHAAAHSGAVVHAEGSVWRRPMAAALHNRNGVMLEKGFGGKGSCSSVSRGFGTEKRLSTGLANSKVVRLLAGAQKLTTHIRHSRGLQASHPFSPQGPATVQNKTAQDSFLPLPWVQTLMSRVSSTMQQLLLSACCDSHHNRRPNSRRRRPSSSSSSLSSPPPPSCFFEQLKSLQLLLII